MSKGSFTFYHADRLNRLSPRSTLLPVNGLSIFGEHYTRLFHSGDVNLVCEPATQREMTTEIIRQQYFPSRPSRFSCLFGANTPSEAEAFAKSIIPVPSYPVKIYEVRAARFLICDMNWLDYIVGTNNPEEKLEYARQYWYPSLTQHAPLCTDRRPPQLEVLLPLPVEIGNVVSIVGAGEDQCPEVECPTLVNASAIVSQ